MNLKEVRTKVIELSGRFDLVVDVTDYVDNGANFFIQQGQRWLDRKARTDKEYARHFQQAPVGKFAIMVEHCRVIKEVWIADDESRLELKKIDYRKLRGTDYPTGENAYVKPFSEMTQGDPLYYSPVNLRLAPEGQEQVAGLYGGFLGYLDVLVGNDANVNGIIMLPPPDKEFMVEIVGKFYSNSLTNDVDISAWSEKYPDILIMSALRHMEIFNRNSEGVKDWTSSILDALIDIDMDVAEEESTETTQFEG